MLKLVPALDECSAPLTVPPMVVWGEPDLTPEPVEEELEKKD